MPKGEMVTVEEPKRIMTLQWPAGPGSPDPVCRVSGPVLPEPQASAGRPEDLGASAFGPIEIVHGFGGAGS
ncbi:hypothetical protein GCM10017600_23890 [Streptosporangium carneum]|uniref:Uncharacterized protein n=1 Tax=Streptosporangium carneum TaxID=47481 RepID=A0A9W6MCQ7_9ACTN|nr:hypothetical protein GCM10017600_23890 [Streptosporangium carneum]